MTAHFCLIFTEREKINLKFSLDILQLFNKKKRIYIITELKLHLFTRECDEEKASIQRASFQMKNENIKEFFFHPL